MIKISYEDSFSVTCLTAIILIVINFSLDGWGPVSINMSAPTLFLATLEVDTPYDTFLDMRGWGRGVVFINGFNLGRYFDAGPTHSLYIPAPLLKTGTNHVSSLRALA
jgi:beta-galactosidase